MSNESPIASLSWLEQAQADNRLSGYSIEQIKKRLAYGSFVGGDFRYVFMETPKAACSSMKWIIADLEGREVEAKHFGTESSKSMIIHFRPSHNITSLAKLDGKQISRIFKDTGTVRFCVVRNPYSRLVSAWADKIRQKEVGYGQFWSKIAAHFRLPAPRCPSFREFALWLTKTQTQSICNPHWRPMSYLLLPELLDYTHVLHTENLAEGLQSVLDIIAPGKNATELLQKHRVNESLPVDWQACYDEETAHKVARFYKADFDRYGYSLDSWKPAPKPKASPKQELEILRNRLAQYESAALEAVRSRNETIAELLGKN